MSSKEASARLKINDTLKASWWRLLDEWAQKANVVVESNATMESLGDDFEKTEKGFIDYLLTDNDGFPLCVLEAKSSDKDPLIGKEQARRYAIAKNVRFIILSNGNNHYFRDRQSWNPQIIFHFPRMEEMLTFKEEWSTNTIKHLVDTNIEADFLARLKKPDYAKYPEFHDNLKRWEFLREYKLKFLRKFQMEAIRSIQRWVNEWRNRFLFEMATGTGKTLTSAGIINLFLKSGTAKRVLFLVDRLELENQAHKSFVENLGTDYRTVIFKKNRDDRKQAEIVVSTIQSFAYNNKYKNLFSPYDFGLIISDESHRSVSGNNRAVFEYFIGYKLGLTATPKDYLKKIDEAQLSKDDPRELERRELLDTYKVFWCESGEPTYRYSLNDGVNDPDGPYLVNPISIDCRTEITTELLSKEWYKVEYTDDNGDEVEKIYGGRHFEKTFFSDETNRAMMKAFMENALKDPISGETGKTIIFAVSRKHAGKITQILNEIAHQMYPWKYNSDFAMQITSDVVDAQQFTINFANNKLSWHTNFLSDYDSSKTRVCVTVGMMTTGYDCEDVLNLCLCRPIFSPTDFVQIKGRGTRICDFRYEGKNISKKELRYKLFDFFANCEYFEKEFDYDQKLKLPKVGDNQNIDNMEEYDNDVHKKVIKGWFESQEDDQLATINERIIGKDGMKIDRELYAQSFEKEISAKVLVDSKLQALAESFDEPGLEQYAREFILDKPAEFFTVEKLNQSYGFERILWLGEIMMKALGLLPWGFKSKNQLVDEAFDDFTHIYESKCLASYEGKQIFRTYILDKKFQYELDNEPHKVMSNPLYNKHINVLWWECIRAIQSYVKVESPKLLQLSAR